MTIFDWLVIAWSLATLVATLPALFLYMEDVVIWSVLRDFAEGFDRAALLCVAKMRLRWSIIRLALILSLLLSSAAYVGLDVGGPGDPNTYTFRVVSFGVRVVIALMLLYTVVRDVQDRSYIRTQLRETSDVD